jgi:hypothetical protein
MEYERERAWEEQPEAIPDPLVDEDLAQELDNRYTESYGDADSESEEFDPDYAEWLEMDIYFAGYSREEAKKMAREQLQRERAWHKRPPAD